MRSDGDGQWESWNVNGYLAQQGWVSDADGNDYCGAAARCAATEGRKLDATQIG